MEVYGPLADAGSFGDVLDGQTPVSVPQQQLRRRVEDSRGTRRSISRIVKPVGRCCHPAIMTKCRIWSIVPSRDSIRSVAASESTQSIAAIIEENSAGAEQVSAASQEMSAQIQYVVDPAAALADMARRLDGFVEQFNLARRLGPAQPRLDVAILHWYITQVMNQQTGRPPTVQGADRAR